MKHWSLVVRRILSVLCGLGMLAGVGFLLAGLWKLGMVPAKYMGILAGVLAVVGLLLIFFLFPGKKREKKTGFTVMQVISMLLALAVGGGCFAGAGVLAKADETFRTITEDTEVAAQIHVLVTAQDPAGSLSDAAGYRFGITDAYDLENTQKTLTELEKLLGKPVEIQSYPSVLAMVGGLYTGDVQAVILNAAYAPVLESTEEFYDFGDRIRVLYQYEVLRPVEPETKPTEQPEPAETEKPQETTQPADPMTLPFIVYLSGSDSRYSKLTQQSNSDVNILAAVSPMNKQILLVNTPRDYFVPNPAGDGALDKLTHCGIYGIECSMQALSDLYGQPVTYNAKINFRGFETLIDAIGGVTIYSENGDGVLLHAGENHMNGEEALHFARNRKSYGDGDNARGRHQMQVISAVVDKMTSGALIRNYGEIMDSLQGMFATSMPSDVIAGYVKMQLEDMAPWEVFSYAVTGTGGEDIPYSFHAPLYAYVMYPNEEKVAFASDLLGKVLAGERLTEEALKN